MFVLVSFQQQEKSAARCEKNKKDKGMHGDKSNKRKSCRGQTHNSKAGQGADPVELAS